MASSSSILPRIRLVAFNDVYELTNLPRLQTFLTKLKPAADAVLLAGDFLSPSPLSALDGGKGMVATLRAAGLTHLSLGNHEADLRLPVLEKRLTKLSENVSVLNANVGRSSAPRGASFLSEKTLMHAIVPSSCGRAKIALTGLLSDEKSIFRKGTFRGASIDNVLDTYESIYHQSVDLKADMLIPITHQTLGRDKELAQKMLETATGKPGLIVGGHEHEPFDVTVSSSSGNIGGDDEANVRILKAGSDAEAVHVIDLTFEPCAQEEGPARLVELDAALVDLADFEPSAVVQNIVDSHMALLRAMENEDIIHADSFLPPGVPLSSVDSRLRQTTVGGILGLAIKEEMDVDVAMINGATIKGDTNYGTSTMSYAELKKELPFPTKMVAVPMKRWELHEAIHYSRTQPPSPDERFQRKGYLQVDAEFDRIDFHTGGQDDVLTVALPRNLLAGFCEIVPLMKLGDRLTSEGKIPGEDEFCPAIDLVVRHFSKEKWYELVQDHWTFADLDVEQKGFLTRDDVERMLSKAMGHTPAEFVVDDMMAALDADGNGCIDPGEFSYFLAQMEREHGLLRFD